MPGPQRGHRRRQRHLSQALAIYQRLNVPEAAEATEALASLHTGQAP